MSQAGYRDRADSGTVSNGARSLFLAPGVVLGIGLGGFIDGIVLHQILQWHHFVSSVEGYPTDTVAGLEANVFWDGLFHASMYAILILGLALMWRAWQVVGRRRLPWTLLMGPILIGWGVFNLLDSVVNHYALGIHHIREGEKQAAYDLAFLVFGIALVAVGWLITRAAFHPER